MIQTANKKILTTNNSSEYSLNQDVFLFCEDNMAQVLDFQKGQFYGLDPIGTVMISLVLEQGVEAAIAYMTQTYDVTAEQIRSDLTGLLQDLEQKELIFCKKDYKKNSFLWLRYKFALIKNYFGSVSLKLVKAISLVIRKFINPGITPNRSSVELLLTFSWLSFRFLGWSRTLSLWKQWHQQTDSVDTPKIVIQEVDRIVRETAAWQLFLPMVCKERALVGYHILRAFYGLPAQLVLGINRHPFQVHAWVECEGKVITDDPEHCATFIPVVQYS